jgi:hypothetical protein
MIKYPNTIYLYQLYPNGIQHLSNPHSPSSKSAISKGLRTGGLEFIVRTCGWRFDAENGAGRGSSKIVQIGQVNGMEIAPGLENDIENHTRNSMAILKTTLNLY